METPNFIGMKPVPVKKVATLTVLLLMSLGLMQFVWPFSEPGGDQRAIAPEKVNLALRRTAHQLLRQSGDSTSAIPPVERTGERVWIIRLERAFEYDRLPEILQMAFDAHGIRAEYDVAVLRCDDGTLELGYTRLDFTRRDVPCVGRTHPNDCSNVQVTLAGPGQTRTMLPAVGWVLLGSVLTFAAYRWRSRRPQPRTDENNETGWLTFGQSRLHLANLLLVCGTEQHRLTFREAKLLHLFAARPNQVLERGFILDQVWADEGVLVGRSIDMFVSRLRKKLATDPSLQLVAVHGVGYRLEVG